MEADMEQYYLIIHSRIPSIAIAIAILWVSLGSIYPLILLRAGR